MSTISALKWNIIKENVYNITFRKKKENNFLTEATFWRYRTCRLYSPTCYFHKTDTCIWKTAAKWDWLSAYTQFPCESNLTGWSHMVCIYLPNENCVVTSGGENSQQSAPSKIFLSTEQPTMRTEIPVAGRVKRFISSSRRPDRLWRPPSLMSLGTEGTFPDAKWLDMKLTIRPHLLPRLRMNGAITHCLLCLHILHRENFTFRMMTFWILRPVRIICLFPRFLRNWFRCMTKQCSTETSEAAYDLKRRKKSEERPP
jgi:hypothetical protein